MRTKLHGSRLLMALVFVFVSLAFSISALAQSSTEWILDATVSNVKCYHMITQCNGENAVLLKFENERSATTKISWDCTYTTNLSQPSVNPEGRQSIHLKWGVNAASDCAGGNTVLYLKASHIDASCTQISQFDFSNITIE